MALAIFPVLPLVPECDKLERAETAGDEEFVDSEDPGIILDYVFAVSFCSLGLCCSPQQIF